MRQLARLVFLAGAVAIGLFLFRANPRDVTLVYDVGPGPARALDVEIDRGAEAIRRAEFRLDAGPARQVRHPVRLPDGEYTVRFTISRGGSEPTSGERPLTVMESGTVVLPL